MLHQGNRDVHQENCDGFCIVSSDSDFTALALRLRESGKVVYGFGEGKTPISLRAACQKFTCMDAWNPQHKSPISAKLDPREAIKHLEAGLNGNKWSTLSGLGQRLKRENPHFDRKHYACKSLSDLARQTNAFEIETPKGSIMRIRAKAG